MAAGKSSSALPPTLPASGKPPQAPSSVSQRQKKNSVDKGQSGVPTLSTTQENKQGQTGTGVQGTSSIRSRVASTVSGQGNTGKQQQKSKVLHQTNGGRLHLPDEFPRTRSAPPELDERSAPHQPIFIPSKSSTYRQSANVSIGHPPIAPWPLVAVKSDLSQPKGKTVQIAPVVVPPKGSTSVNEPSPNSAVEPHITSSLNSSSVPLSTLSSSAPSFQNRNPLYSKAAIPFSVPTAQVFYPQECVN